MLTLILGLAATGAATMLGYAKSRSFVRNRLRYVDGVHRPGVPLLAAAGALAIAVPVVSLLPLVGSGTALLFGAGVGAGVSAGRREIWARLHGG